MTIFKFEDGQTPLTPEEKDGLLLDYITTRNELNEAEQRNILVAEGWLFRSHKRDVFSEEFLKLVHKRMFSNVWRWAGAFRLTNKNIGCQWWEIAVELRNLLEDGKTWQNLETYGTDELAVRFHHRLVKIHLFPNGNGRHARLVADYLVRKLGGSRFPWGRAPGEQPSQIRRNYIRALEAADREDIRPLLVFARSGE